MLRALDIILAFVGLILLAPVFGCLLIIGFFVSGSPIFSQVRLGLNKEPFVIYKFRTMKRSTASLPTHLIKNQTTTTFGKILRTTKLDEIPQLWNVLKGEMSLVGPRPGLANQHELTILREKLGVFSAKPGITGLSQISGIDMSRPKELAECDADMIRSMSLKNYFRYIFGTFKPTKRWHK